MEQSTLVRRSSSSVLFRMSFKKRSSSTDGSADATSAEIPTILQNGDQTIRERQSKSSADNLPSLRSFYVFSSFLVIDFIGMLLLDTPLISG
jgi:hypothetical protein